MGASCSVSQSITKNQFDDQDFIFEEGSIQNIQIVKPKINKVALLAENCDQGVNFCQIHAIIIQPENKAQITEIFKFLDKIHAPINIQTNIQDDSHSKKHRTSTQLTPDQLSQKHVHFDTSTCLKEKHTHPLRKNKLKH